MHNRRVQSRDSSAISEYLNEVNEYGQGIRVKSAYYIQMYNSTVRLSSTRTIQQMVDSPPQYWFAFSTSQLPQARPEFTFTAAIFPEYVRVISLPKAKGSILFRLENIHD